MCKASNRDAHCPERTDADFILFVGCTSLLSLLMAVCSSHQACVQQLSKVTTAISGAQKASLAFRVTEHKNPHLPKTCSWANRLGDSGEDNLKEE